MPASILVTPVHLNDGKSLQGNGVCPLQVADLVRFKKTWRERNEKQVARYSSGGNTRHLQSKEESAEVWNVYPSGPARNAIAIHRITRSEQSTGLERGRCFRRNRQWQLSDLAQRESLREESLLRDSSDN